MGHTDPGGAHPMNVDVEARMLTELGWPHTPDEVVARFMGRSSESVLNELETHLGPEKTRWFDEHCTIEVHAAFDRELVAIPGVRELIGALATREVATCVASSGSHAKMSKTLGLSGLFADFDSRIFSASEVEHGKPAPDLFLFAAAAMGVDPTRTAVIEDSVYGVQAAVAAGIGLWLRRRALARGCACFGRRDPVRPDDRARRV